MKLGLGSYAVAWSMGVPGYPVANPLDAIGLIRLAAELDLHLVQIADNFPLDILSPAQLDAIWREGQRLGVTIEVGTRGIQPEHLRRYIDIALRMGSQILRVVIDSRDFQPSVGEAAELIQQILPDLEAADVILAIENHDRFTTRGLVELIHTLDSSYAGICLDTVNSFGALEGPEVVVDALGAYVVNLHIKDFRVRRFDHNMGFIIEGTPAGQGMLNVPWLLHRLNMFGRSFNAIIEHWPMLEASVEATTAKEQRWVQESTAYLRMLIPD